LKRISSAASARSFTRTGERRDQVPGNRANQTTQNDVWRHVLKVDHRAAHGFGDAGAHHENGQKIKRGSPQHSLIRSKNAGGHDGRYRIGGVMETVDEMSINLVKDAVGLLFEHMNLMSGVRQVGVPCGRPFDQQAGSLTDQLDLPLKRLKELFVAWKQIHVRSFIFSHAIRRLTCTDRFTVIV
jgi:hypothetical protein